MGRIGQVLTAVPAGVALLLAGCGVQVPADPDGTLDRVRDSGTLRAGASPNEPWVQLPAQRGGEPGGVEPDLVEAFADRLGAEVEWTVSGEEDLVGRMERGELDLVVGGLTADNPHGSSVGLTRPWTESTGPEGRTLQHVLAVPRGENAMLAELESFLDEQAP